MSDGRSVLVGPAFAERLDHAAASVRQLLLEERTNGVWVGCLSASALSTATAMMAMEMVGRSQPDPRFAALIDRGLAWLARTQNVDGGWGDTVRSISNISTTMLAHAVFAATERTADYPDVCRRAADYIDRAGGVEAVLQRYGSDRTFSIPILTHCALAGVADWKHVLPLPFELACLPARFYKTVRLPVVSYALPALIAIGQAVFTHRPPWNPVTRLIRSVARRPTLRVLNKIQPTNGGFLEATPLTSFVTMSLAGCGLADHDVARRGIEFIIASVREDGSWPIDTNLSTWVTTLSVNGIGEHLSPEEGTTIKDWLLSQQYRVRHPYTNADPGGWAWTDLPGGVPDADDTPGAILALLALTPDRLEDELREALELSVRWLLDLQNRDGGWPTFCRGWGRLPFDRSSADISAHVLRALHAWQDRCPNNQAAERIARAAERGFRFLQKAQRGDGSWLPLWFGNQHAEGDENPVYGTSRVLMALRDCDRLDTPPGRAAMAWLREQQNDDGGWGGVRGTESTVEETSLAVEALLGRHGERGLQGGRPTDSSHDATDTNGLVRGLQWLVDKVERDGLRTASPIGFYFAKLWYFENLYPVTFAASALNRAVRVCSPDDAVASQPAEPGIDSGA